MGSVKMGRLVRQGNSVYEVDEECLKNREKEKKQKRNAQVNYEKFKYEIPKEHPRQRGI
jgi:hypothetical protein